MKKIQLLGVEAKDFSVREALHLTGEYLSNDVLNVVYYLSGDSLIAADDSEEIRLAAADSDITIPATTEILHMAGIGSKTRENETAKNLYMKGLLRMLIRNRKSVYMVADGEERLEEMKNALSRIQSGLLIAGTVVLNETTGEEDAVNEINGVIPDAVFLLLSTPDRERFIREQKLKINSKLLLSLCDDIVNVREDGTLKRGGIRDWLRNKLFRKLLGEYEGGKQ